jgi:transcriptional regulator with XRE-family HTH domain
MQNSPEKAIIERITALRKQYAGERGKSKFAQAMGISPSTYNYYESDRVPPVEILLKMCEVTGADLNWLLAGKEPAEKTTAEPQNFNAIAEKKNIRHTGGLLSEKLGTLLEKNPEFAEPISAFAELLCEKKGIESNFKTEVLPAESNRPGWIPVLGRTAAGMVHFWDEMALPQSKQAITELEALVQKHIGKAIISCTDGALSVDLQARPLVEGIKKQQANLVQVGGERAEEEVVEFVQCEEMHRLFPDSFALRVDGDSMSPRINDGDVVILSPSVPAAQGHIAVARLSNQIGVTCKLIRSADDTVHLIPINEKYQSKVVPKRELQWALAVLCHIRV